MLLLAECFLPFRQQHRRFQSFCSFKRASFGYSSPAVLIPQNIGSGGGGRVTVAPAVLNEPDRKHLLRTSGQTRDRTSTIQTAKSPAGTSLLTGAPAAAAAGRNNTKRGLREFWTETTGEEV